jgi:hypothetical protein
MTRHIGTALLASYRDDDVGRRRAARIRAHLADCSRCAGVSADLAAVTAMLADVRVPPIPDRLATRLQDALAAESSQRAAAAPDLAADARRPRLPQRTRHWRRPRLRPGLRLPAYRAPIMLRAVAGVAVAAVLAGGGYLLVTRSISPSSGHSASAAAPGRPAARRPSAGLEENGPLALPYRRHGGTDTTSAVSSQVNFTRSSLGSQMRRQVDKHVMFSLGPKPQSSVNSRAAGLAPGSLGGVSVRQLEACVSRVAAGLDVLVVEVARYEGAAATIIVAAKSAGARTLQITVVRRSCSASVSDIVFRVTVPAS